LTGRSDLYGASGLSVFSRLRAEMLESSKLTAARLCQASCRMHHLIDPLQFRLDVSFSPSHKKPDIRAPSKIDALPFSAAMRTSSTTALDRAIFLVEPFPSVNRPDIMPRQQSRHERHPKRE
jgi:hypothetical protein